MMVAQRPLAWFSKWLHIVFPIKKEERKKVFLLLILKFLISFVFCILSGLKDTLLVTAHCSAAEVIPIIKGSLIFPISVGVVALYTILSNRFNQATLFYSAILFFLTLILCYGFILYPNIDKVSPNKLADWLNTYTAHQYLHWVAVFRHWIHVLFFIVAELWGQVILMVLYWSFVNSVCTIQDAKRLYAILIAAGDVALIISAPLILAYTKKYSHINFACTVQALIGYIVICCICILFIYRWVARIANPKSIAKTAHVDNSKKLTLSLWSSLKHVAKSRYLAYITVIMVACGLSINIVEGTWKSYLKELFPKSADYQIFSSNCSFWTGIIALIFSLFFSGGILRKFGWSWTARITPVIIGMMGCLFFLMSYGKTHLVFLNHWAQEKLLLYIAVFGAIHTIMAKATKYAFFDKTTQIAYIPLDPETKIKGKAAVDLLGSRLGKAGSSWIQIALLELFHTNTIQPLSGGLLGFLLITVMLWYHAIGKISNRLTALEESETRNNV